MLGFLNFDGWLVCHSQLMMQVAQSQDSVQGQCKACEQSQGEADRVQNIDYIHYMPVLHVCVHIDMYVYLYIYIYTYVYVYMHSL